MITSAFNKKIKEITKLNYPKYRKGMGMFIVEGNHLIEEAYKNGMLTQIFVLKGESINYDVPIDEVTPEVMKKISTLDNIPKIIGICKMKEEKELGNKLIILDGVQDPGNLGTIIRSSVAFNVDTIVLSNDTVDLYNEKVIRATQGMIFNINIIRRDLETFISKIKEDGYKIYSTNVDDGVNVKTIEKVDKYAIIMGSEGNGVSNEINSLSDEFIYIDMSNKCESLNVGVAASIILYELNSR